jgi:hypothetical protein
MERDQRIMKQEIERKKKGEEVRNKRGDMRGSRGKGIY